MRPYRREDNRPQRLAGYLTRADMLAVTDTSVDLFTVLRRRHQLPFDVRVDQNKDGLLPPAGPRAILHISRPGEPVPKDAEGLGWHPLAALALKVSNDAAAMGARRELAAEMGRVAIKVYPDRWAEVLTRSAPRIYVAAVYQLPVPDPNVIVTTYPHIAGNFQGATGVFAVSISDAVATMRNLARKHGVASFFHGPAE